MISGNMSDIVSNLYLSYSVLWYDKHFQKVNETNAFLRDECIHYLMNELDTKMNVIIANYPFPLLKPLLYPITNKITYENLENKNKLYKLIIENEELHNIFKNDIYYQGTVLEKMETLMKMKKNTDEYNTLYQDIISVGEYPLPDVKE